MGSLDFIVRVIQLAIVHVCIKFSIQVKIFSLLQNVIRKIFCQFRASIHFPHHVCTQRNLRYLEAIGKEVQENICGKLKLWIERYRRLESCQWTCIENSLQSVHVPTYPISHTN